MRNTNDFVLIDDGAGTDVTPAVLATIAAAVQRQVREHWAAHWGHPGCTITVGQASADPASPIPVYIRADSTQPGAAGWHDDEAVYVFRDGLPALTTGSFSLSAVISHEVLETLGDKGCNRWADDGRGTEHALEMCDAVESYCYEIDGVSVSDFLLPSYFDPGGQAPYSHMGKPSAPMTPASAGGADYEIVRSVDENGAQQVTADLSAHPRARAKTHPSSRTSRRGVIGSPVASTLPPDPVTTPAL